jgi:hypothetical protein
MNREKDVHYSQQAAQQINWLDAEAHAEKFQTEQTEAKNYWNTRPAQCDKATGDLQFSYARAIFHLTTPEFPGKIQVNMIIGRLTVFYKQPEKILPQQWSC